MPSTSSRRSRARVADEGVAGVEAAGVVGSGVVTRTIVTRGDGLLALGPRRGGGGHAAARARRVSSRTIRPHIHSANSAKTHHCTA